MLFFLSIIVSFNEFIYSFINKIFLCNCLNVIIKSFFFFFNFFHFLFVSVNLFIYLSLFVVLS